MKILIIALIIAVIAILAFRLFARPRPQSIAKDSACALSFVIQPAPDTSRTVIGTGTRTCGKCKLYDTPDRDAAVLMAIVANALGRPLREIQFLSIKEVK